MPGTRTANRRAVLAVLALPTLCLALALSTKLVAAPGTGAPLRMTRGEVRHVANLAELKAGLEAANRAKIATTLLLADGTYILDAPVLSIQCPGLVVRSAKGNRDAVILRGPDEGPDAALAGVFLVSANDVVISDLTLGYCRHHGIQVRGESPFSVSGLRVHNCRIVNCNQQFIKGSSSEADSIGATDGCIEQCLFEFTRGWAYQSYTGGIDIHKGVNWVVRDNEFRNLRTPAGQPGIAEHAVHFWKRCSTRPQNIVVERNSVQNCDRGIGFGLGTAEGGFQGGAGIIRNNLVFNDGTGPHTDVGIGLEHAAGVHVDNNTVVVLKYWAPMEYRFAGSSNLVFRNNLVNGPIQLRDNAPLAARSNNFEHVETAWFRDFAAGDLGLSAAARPVIGAGQALDEFYDDLDGRPRPRESGWDIGACQFGAKTPPGALNRGSEGQLLVPGLLFIRGPINGALIERHDKSLAVYGDPSGEHPTTDTVLLTEARRDTIWAARGLARRGAKVVVPEKEAESLTNPDRFWTELRETRFHDYAQQSTKMPVEAIPVSRAVKEGDAVSWADLVVRVLDTPGYTRGAVSYLDVFVTHYHDDHTDALPALVKEFGAKIHACGSLVELIERPGDYRLPCLTKNPTTVTANHLSGDIEVQ